MKDDCIRSSLINVNPFRIARLMSTQPTPNPIRDRSGRLDEIQDERKTSRSQEICVNSFNEELRSSDRTGRLVETEEIQARSSEDSKSLNVEQTHDRTGRPVNDKVAVQDDPQVCYEAETLNIDDETLRERIRGRHGLQNSRTTTFHCETGAKCQRSRIDSENWKPPKSTCSSTRSTTESIIKSFSVQNQNK